VTFENRIVNLAATEHIGHYMTYELAHAQLAL
jgi:hypothetical protein